MNSRTVIIHEFISTSGPFRRGTPRAEAPTGAAGPTKLGELVRPKRAPACDSTKLVFVSPLPGRWIRCTGAMLAAALLFAAGEIVRAGTGSSFDDANTAFAQGRFADAARGFESVLAEEGCSAPVLYNLANANFRDGKLGAAILNYERALVLAPNDPDIAANLRLARTKAVGSADNPSRGPRFSRLLSFNAWASTAAATLLILCAAILLQRGLRQGRTVARLSGIVAAMAFAIALSALAIRWGELDRAIVTAKESPLRISPTTIGETLFALSEGDAVTVRQTRGDFALVRAGNGRSGWVKRNEIGSVHASAHQ